jgi:hypothetical protein
LATTIGYGSFGPATNGAKLLSCVYLFVGVLIFAGAVSSLALTLLHLLSAPLLDWSESRLQVSVGRYLSGSNVTTGGWGIDDVQKAIKGAQVKVSPEDIKRLFDAANDDGDDKLDPGQEFEKFIQQLASLSASKYKVRCRNIESEHPARCRTYPLINGH